VSSENIFDLLLFVIVLMLAFVRESQIFIVESELEEIKAVLNGLSVFFKETNIVYSAGVFVECADVTH